MTATITHLTEPVFFITPVTPSITGMHMAQEYFKLLEKDGLVSQSFPEQDIQTAEEFAEMLNDGYNRLFLLRIGREYAAHVNLNGFHGKCAQIHFSILRKWHGVESVRLGKWALGQIFSYRNEQGDPWLETIVGATPKANRLACIYIRRVGFRPIETLRQHSRLGDSVLSILHRDEYYNYGW